jgi:hypothetical protein
MKKLIIICIISLFFFPKTEAQSIDPYSEVGLFLGTSYYLGDLNENHFKLAQPAAAINYRYNIDRRVALKGGLWFGELRGADKLNEVDTVKIQRNLHFKSPLYELSGIIEFNFFDYETGSQRYRFTPFLFTGISIFQFNPQARRYYTSNLFDNDSGNGNPWTYLQPLGTEGQNSTAYPEKDSYQLMQFAIPLGIGFKISLSDNFSINAEYGFRRTFTDYLDDVGGTYANPADLFRENETAAYLSDTSLDALDALAIDEDAIIYFDQNAGRQRANENNWKDWYNFAGISFVYKIYTKPKVCKY